MTIEELLAALQAIIDQATAPDGSERALTDEEIKRYEELEVQLAAKRKDVEVRSRQKAYQTPVASPIRPVSTSTKVDDTLERAFDHYLRTGKENADLVQLRAQSEGTPSEGGYLVPDGFRNKLVDRMKAFGGLASVVEEITTSEGNPLPWVDRRRHRQLWRDRQRGRHVLRRRGPGVRYGDPRRLLVHGRRRWRPAAAGLAASCSRTRRSTCKAWCRTSSASGSPASRRSTRCAARASSEPQGIVTGLTPVQPAANTGWTYARPDHVHPLRRPGVPGERRAGRSTTTTLAAIRKLVDGNNRPLLQPSADGAAAGAPGGETLLGYPVTIDQAFVDLDIDDSTDLAGVFGDLREGYVIRRVQAVEILVNPYARMANRQVEFSAWARMDAVQQNTNAYVALSGKS